MSSFEWPAVISLRVSPNLSSGSPEGSLEDDPTAGRRYGRFVTQSRDSRIRLSRMGLSQEDQEFLFSRLSAGQDQIERARQAEAAAQESAVTSYTAHADEGDRH
jgi:hypothetical protein